MTMYAYPPLRPKFIAHPRRFKFMGAVLNPRIGPVDVKMFAEVRIPWVLLFLISVSGACKQYEKLGYVTPNSAFMVLATGL